MMADHKKVINGSHVFTTLVYLYCFTVQTIVSTPESQLNTTKAHLRTSPYHFIPTIPIGKTGVKHMPFRQIEDALISCQWDHVVVIENSSSIGKFQSRLLIHFQKKSIPFTFYQTKDTIIGLSVYKEYVEKRHTNFILISDNHEIILKEVRSEFYKYSRSFLAAFPHRSNWLLLHNGPTPFSNLTAQGSVLDHVAALHMEENEIVSVRTLMWKDQRRRQWESVANSNLGVDCSIYPNKRNGMNGRTLTIGTEIFNYGVKLSKNLQGQLYYSGFLIDIVQELQNSLNFTAKFDPSANQPTRMVEMEVFIQLLANHSVDMGLSYFSQDAAMDNGLKGTYPILFDDVAAAYVYNSSSFQNKRVEFFEHTPVRFQAMILAAFIATVLFHQFLFRIGTWSFNGKNDTQHNLTNDGKNEYKIACSRKRPTTSQSNTAVQQNNEKQEIMDIWTSNGRWTMRDIETNGANNIPQFKSKLINILYHFVRHKPNFHVIDFLGSLLNQNTLERPELFSLRISLFSWCLFVLLVNSIFSGTLTAGLVKSVFRPPFTTVSQVLQSDLVRHGSFDQTEIHKKSTYWCVDGKKWHGELNHFRVNINTSPKEFRRFMEEPSIKPKVFVYYRKLLEYFKSESDFQELYIIQNHFQRAPLGFVLPKESDLESIISTALVRLHETDLINKLSQKYVRGHLNVDNVTKTFKEEVDIDFFTAIFYLVGFCVFVSAFTLGVEQVFHCLMVYFKNV